MRDQWDDWVTDRLYNLLSATTRVKWFIDSRYRRMDVWWEEPRNVHLWKVCRLSANQSNSFYGVYSSRLQLMLHTSTWKSRVRIRVDKQLHLEQISDILRVEHEDALEQHHISWIHCNKLLLPGIEEEKKTSVFSITCNRYSLTGNESALTWNERRNHKRGSAPSPLVVFVWAFAWSVHYQRHLRIRQKRHIVYNDKSGDSRDLNPVAPAWCVAVDMWPRHSTWHVW